MADQIQIGSLGGARANGARLAYIDWLRGLACVIMFQAHSYSSWLNPQAQKTEFYRWSQAAATLPAPMFIFLAGVSSAMVTQRLREKGIGRNAIARASMLRGAEIFGLGLLFRGQEYLLGFPNAPWTDLLRVDVLNILGVAMMLMGVVTWATAVSQEGDASFVSEDKGKSAAATAAPRDGVALKRTPTIFVAWATPWGTIILSLVTAAGIAIATPWVWTTHRPRWLPWPVESYINGVHIFDRPQTWLFPIFPWVAFAFVGLSLCFLLFADFAKKREGWFLLGVGATGAIACVVSQWLDASRVRLYSGAIYDYWHSSPEFFLMRTGILLMLMFLAYAWCRWGLAQKGFSPLIQLGNTSLLVYWVHIEFVYGRFSILPKGKCSIPKATMGFLTIFAAMVALSVLRTRWKKRRARAKALPAEGPVPVAATGESG